MRRTDYARSDGRGQRGTLTQLADGRWQARYRDGGRTGSRPQKTFPTKRAAADWLRDRLDELDAVRNGDTGALVRAREKGLTVQEAIGRYQAAHDASDARKQVLAYQLRLAEREFGDRPLASLEPYDLEAWRRTLSPGYRRDVFGAFKQVLRAAVRWEWIGTNPAAAIPNPRGHRRPVTPIPWPHLLLVADEIDARYAHVPVLAAGSGLRPEEYLALERGDVNRAEMVIEVRRVWSSEVLVDLGADGAKTKLQRRRVPLRQVVLDALDATPARLDTKLLVPPARPSASGYMDLGSFRDRFWRPAFVAAGVPYQRPYDARHTFAADAIAADVNLFDLSRFMGTSLREIDQTYGHLVDDSEERARRKLDAYDAARPQAAEGRL
jgi:integrase